MNKFYFPQGNIYFFAFVLLLFLLLGWLWISLGLIIFAIIYGFIFRKAKKIKEDGNIKSHGILRSPCFGNVKSIRSGINHKEFGDNMTEILITIPHFKEFGLYFPCASEMDFSFRSVFKNFFRYRRSYNLDQSNGLIGGHFVRFRTPSNLIVGMQLIKCHLGLEPTIWILPGDRGASGARLGMFPFGGSVLLFLSKDFEVVAKIGDKLIGGDTLLAKEKVVDSERK